MGNGPSREDVEERMRREREQWQREQEEQHRRRVEEENRRAHEARERARQEQERAAAEQRRAEHERQQAEENRRRAEEAARQLEAQRQRAEEQRLRAEQEKREAEEHRRRMEQERQRLEAERRRAEEEQRRAEQAQREAQEQKRRADEERQRAEDKRRRAEEEKRRADEERKKAEAERRRAEEAALKAKQEKQRAEEERKRAEKARQQAEAERLRAEEDRKRAEEKRRKAEEDKERARVAQEEAERASAAAKQAADEARTAQEDAERRLKAGIRPVVWPTADEIRGHRERLQYREGKFHLAIAGIAGSGKSSLINALRGINNRHPDAARVGVAETTRVTTRYEDPHKEWPFVWYDVPGAGTLAIPDWRYFNEFGLYIFDAIIVLFDNRFTETDVALLRNAERFLIPTYIVRSKSVQHISNLLSDLDFDDDEDDVTRLAIARETYIKETRATVVENLLEAGLPSEQRSYLIAAKEVMCELIKGRSPAGTIDERELLTDIFKEARVPASWEALSSRGD